MADSLIDLGADLVAEKAALTAKWSDKTKEEILSAKVESDLFIKSQNARFDELRDSYLTLKDSTDAKLQLKDLLDRKAAEDTGNNHSTQSEQQLPQMMKPEDIDSLVERKLSEHQRTLKQQENMNSIKAQLKDKFGDNSQTILKQRMDTLGLSQEFADDLAKNYPSAFIRTFGLDEQPSPNSNFQVPPRSVKQASFAPHTPTRNYAYYQELKKTNPKLYLDPKLSVQMYNDALEQGASFGLPN